MDTALSSRDGILCGGVVPTTAAGLPTMRCDWVTAVACTTLAQRTKRKKKKRTHTK